MTLPHFNSMTCNTQYTGPTSNGLQVLGIWPRSFAYRDASSDFSLSTCPAFNSLNSCFFAKNGITKQNISITGFQASNSNGNPASQTCILNDGTDDFTINVGLYGIFAATGFTHLAAYCTSAVGATPQRKSYTRGHQQAGRLTALTNPARNASLAIMRSSGFRKPMPETTFCKHSALDMAGQMEPTKMYSMVPALGHRLGTFTSSRWGRTSLTAAIQLSALSRDSIPSLPLLPGLQTSSPDQTQAPAWWLGIPCSCREQQGIYTIQRRRRFSMMRAEIPLQTPARRKPTCFLAGRRFASLCRLPHMPLLPPRG